MQSQSQGVSPPQLCSCQTSCTIAARQDSALPAPARYSGWAQGSSRDPQAALPSPDGLCLSPGVISFGLLGKIYSALSKLPVTAGHYVELDLQVEPCPILFSIHVPTLLPSLHFYLLVLCRIPRSQAPSSTGSFRVSPAPVLPRGSPLVPVSQNGAAAMGDTVLGSDQDWGGFSWLWGAAELPGAVHLRTAPQSICTSQGTAVLGVVGVLVLRHGPQLKWEQLCPCAMAGLEYSSERKSVHCYLCPAQPWKSHFTSYKRI